MAFPRLLRWRASLAAGAVRGRRLAVRVPPCHPGLDPPSPPGRARAADRRGRLRRAAAPRAAPPGRLRPAHRRPFERAAARRPARPRPRPQARALGPPPGLDLPRRLGRHPPRPPPPVARRRLPPRRRPAPLSAPHRQAAGRRARPPRPRVPRRRRPAPPAQRRQAPRRCPRRRRRPAPVRPPHARPRRPHPPRFARPRHLPPVPRRPPWPPLHPLQIPHHAPQRRCRRPGPPRRRPRSALHPPRPLAPPPPPRRAAAVAQHPARRDEPRRPPPLRPRTGSRVRPRHPLLRPALERRPRRHRLGPSQPRLLRHPRRQPREARLRPLLHPARLPALRLPHRRPNPQGPPPRPGRPMTLDLALAAVFWSCCALILYTYAGYPLLLFLGSSALELRNAWRRLLEPLPLPADGEPPTVNAEPISVVVAAHNEEADLPGLIESLRRSDYPSGLIEIIVVSDGSTDRTNPYLQSLDLPNLQLVLLPRQQGKANALNQGVARARHQLLLLTDASTRLQPDTIACLARHFADPRVGVVCGALRFLHHPGTRHTEGAYWSYECLLRLMEGRLGATLTASGALYALRKSCFPPLRATAWIEDFLVPMHARHEGYRVLYDPDAWATEIPAPSVAGEFKRRARLAV